MELLLWGGLVVMRGQRDVSLRYVCICACVGVGVGVCDWRLQVKLPLVGRLPYSVGFERLVVIFRGWTEADSCEVGLCVLGGSSPGEECENLKPTTRRWRWENNTLRVRLL